MKSTRRIGVILSLALAYSMACVAQSGIQYPEQDSITAKKDYPYVLPIWGQKVADRGIHLQLPFGANINYVYNQMTLELTQFSLNFFDGENLDDIINPETLNFKDTKGTLNGVNFRFDAWVLPFLNIYGFYSRNQGSTQVSFQPQVIEKGLGPNGNLMEIRTLENPIEVAPVYFTTNSFGTGATAVYGWGDGYFVGMDGNVSWSTSDLLEQTVNFFVTSARIGRRITFKNDMKLAIYIGAMYRDFVNKENNTGSIPVPELDEAMINAIDGLTEINNVQIEFWESMPDAAPGKDEKLAELYNRDERLTNAKSRVENSDAINYSIKKEIIENWSTQIGYNFEISDHWMVRGELGYRAGQKFLMTGLQYRFGL